MERIDLSELFVLQKELDDEIANQHHVSYETTQNERSLALLVELGELANETRCFKYWSFKPASAKEIVLDEFADGLHFFISLGLAANIKGRIFVFDTFNDDLSKGFLKTYELASNFFNNRTEENYTKAFTLFLSLYKKLGFEIEDILLGYKKKLEVNHKRQENKY